MRVYGGASTLAGVTPGAIGLALLDDATTQQARTTIGAIGAPVGPSSGESLVHTGTTWDHAFSAGIYGTRTSPPAEASWTWVNQGSATWTVTNGVGELFCPKTSSANLRVLTRPLPHASNDYTVTALIAFQSDPVDFHECGIGWRESGTGKISNFKLTYGGAVYVSKWTSPTSFSAEYVSNLYSRAAALTPVWVQIAKVGSNRVVRVSANGRKWNTIHSVSNSDFFTSAPDQICILGLSQHSNATYTDGATVAVFHWAEAT